MEKTNCIQIFAETLGKPVSAFTKTDWRRAAYFAENNADILYAFIQDKPNAPAKKKPGRPRKKPLNNLAELLKNSDAWKERKYTGPNKRGRPQANYYGFSAEAWALAVSKLATLPDAPKEQIQIIKVLSRQLSHETGKGYHDPETIARGILRARKRAADKIRKKTP